MAKLKTCDKHVVAFINMPSDAGSIPATSITTLHNESNVSLVSKYEIFNVLNFIKLNKIKRN